jgi:methyl-accepting chemotaxis protein
MKWFRNMKIAKKIIAGFLVVVFLAITVGVVGVINILNIKDNDARLYQEDTQGLEYAGEAAVVFMQIRYYSLRLLYAQEQSVKEETVSALDENFNQMDGLLVKCFDTIRDPETIAILDEIQANWDVYKPAMRANNEASVKGELTEVDQAMVALGTTLRENYTSLFGKISEVALIKADNNAAIAQNAIVTSIGVIVGAVIIALWFGIIISRAISKPIKSVATAAEQMAKGNFAFSVLDGKASRGYSDQKDEVGELSKSFDSVVESVKSLVEDANMLADATMEGKLMTKANANKHQGDYKKIIAGINDIINTFTDDFDRLPSPVMVIDKEFNVQYMNKTGADLLNKTKNELVGTKCYDVFKTSDCKTANCACQRAMNERKEVSRETDAHPQAGTDLLISYKGTPITKNGQVIGAFEVVTDQTEIKKAKAQAEKQAETLTVLLSDVNTAAEQVAAGTKQVSDGSQEISQGATEQSSSIEELTASVTEIAEQTRQNAMSANKANELTTTAMEEASRGSEQMMAMQQAMTEINEASENISKIIKVIDDIAFQTNILALNAAVEAARAGVHGKGFAVVAEEVRNLAARSAGAAKETTEMIEGSIRKAEAGTKIANETAAALSSIVSGVENAAQLVGEIANASNEQASAITQVNHGIEQMSQVVQTNSATSEETAAAAEELSSQAELLKNMVGQFNLKGDGMSSKTMMSAKPKEERISTPSVSRIRLTDGDFGKY